MPLLQCCGSAGENHFQLPQLPHPSRSESTRARPFKFVCRRLSRVADVAAVAAAPCPQAMRTSMGAPTVQENGSGALANLASSPACLDRILQVRVGWGGGDGVGWVDKNRSGG
jgi:hypothetical protein